MGKTISGLLMTTAVLAMARTAAAKPDQWFYDLDCHASELSDTPNRSLTASTFGYGLRGGRRRGNWGLFLQAEHNLWSASNGIESGALNVGLGLDRLSGRGFVRTSLAAGPSVLLFNSLLDKPGTAGVFVDFRPVGLRWHAGRTIVGLDPLSFALVAPALGGIPLVRGEYRTVLSMEL